MFDNTLLEVTKTTTADEAVAVVTTALRWQSVAPQLVSNSSITGWQQEEEIQGLDTVHGHDDAGGAGRGEAGRSGRSLVSVKRASSANRHRAGCRLAIYWQSPGIEARHPAPPRLAAPSYPSFLNDRSIGFYCACFPSSRDRSVFGELLVGGDTPR